MSAVIVAKFGGTSLADASQFKKMKNIILSNPDRRYVVPSAPGKRFKDDTKVTDMLYKFYQTVEAGQECGEAFESIAARFIEIRDQLGIGLEIEKYLEEIKDNTLNGATKDYVASRGEYLNGIIAANYLGFKFIDAAEVIFFDKKGKYDAKKTKDVLKDRLSDIKNAVIPGFYGSLPDGRIKTFSRGGSDITGAIVAGALGADLYENWTDVSGFLTADPRIVCDPKKIECITYRELRELSYMGATVLHEDAIFPVFQAAIPINVKNTNNPGDSGTMIVPNLDKEDIRDLVTGIAGKKGFTVISIEKNCMNSELGFGRRVLSCIEKYGAAFEHMPSSIDTLCVVIQDTKLQDNLKDIVEDIYRACEPDSVETFSNMALIATVGKNMARHIGVAAKLFTSLAEEDINVRMIDQGSSEINIIVGVENDDFDRAINAIYKALIG